MRVIAVATTHGLEALGRADIIALGIADVTVETAGNQFRVTVEPMSVE